MIEIYDGFFVNPWKVTVVKATDTDKCILYVSGQSARDGFEVNRNALEVATDILEEMREDETTDEDEEEE